MAKIENLDDLRDRVLDAFEGLENNTVDIQKAGIIAKLSETVISGIKTQMEYARMMQQTPSIPFISSCKTNSNTNNIKLIENKKTKNERR